MERLQQAIHRARQERQGQLGHVRPVEQRYAHSAPRKPTTRPEPVGYSCSRVVRLDDAHMEANRVIAGRGGDERVEAYRQLRTQVLHTFTNNDWLTLAITSPTKNAGKTLTAVNLAISLAQEVNHSVLLVDLDLSHPDVNNVMGVDIKYGVNDILQGKATVEQALFNPDMERLLVLPCRPTEDYSSELLTSPEMSALLRELKTRYAKHIVIFDLPPLLRNDDALKFTPFVDATLMVVEAGRTTPDELERSSHLMKNANLIGTILNKAV